MDFFQAQTDARRRTRLLAVLFLLSLVCLLALANLFLYLLFDQSRQPGFYLATSASILLIVFASSFYKNFTLRQGGEAIAQMLDARLLVSPSDKSEQRLLNIVEEIAIASGTPVPPAYIMEESSINAFAAGHSINDAVIGITRGAINKLNRDELQGVIAHEFSHILHGDMRLNIRLIGWIHGIMVLSVIGHYLLRAAATSRRNTNHAAIGLLGAGLIALGASGSFFGSLIKAAVSRQREYLADASAVQYTRNPQGIAGALKRIALDADNDILANPAAAQISHALFTEGVRLRFRHLFATHPPLEDRIRAIDPYWDGNFHAPDLTAPMENPVSDVSAASAPFSTLAIALAIARAGAPDDVDVSDAMALHRSIPPELSDAAHNTLGAAAILCLLLAQPGSRAESPATFQADYQRRLATLQQAAICKNNLMAEMQLVLPAVLGIKPQYRLPVINICLGTLRQMSVQQYDEFRITVTKIVAANNPPPLTNWILYQLTVQHLDRAFSSVPPDSLSAQKSITRLTGEISLFLSFLSYCGHSGEREAEAAFHAACNAVKLSSLTFINLQDLDFQRFQQAVSALVCLAQADKKRLLDAVGICVYFDAKLTVIESELLRMTSEMLGLPLPAKIFR